MLSVIITSFGLEILVSNVPEVASVIATPSLLSSLVDEIEPWELSSIEVQLEAYTCTAINQELSCIIEWLNTIGIIVETSPFGSYIKTSGSVTYTSYSAGIVTGSGGTASGAPSQTTFGGESKTSSSSTSKDTFISSKLEGIDAGFGTLVVIFIGAMGLTLL